MIFIPRAQWHSVSRLGAHMGVVDTVFIHHSVTTATADPCGDALAIERIGITRFGKLSYSHMVHPSGVVLEGQADHVGAHTEGWNSRSVGVCLIGNMLTHPITDQALQATVDLINIMRLFKGISANPRVLPHRAVQQTACPGLPDNKLNWIRYFTSGRG